MMKNDDCDALLPGPEAGGGTTTAIKDGPLFEWRNSLRRRRKFVNRGAVTLRNYEKRRYPSSCSNIEVGVSVDYDRYTWPQLE